MLRIRLSRTGKKKQPSYRVVVANIESKRDGRVVERIGHVNPLVDPSEYKIEEDRALYWLSVGAQPSDAVRRLLEKQGTFDRLTRLHQGEPLDALVAEYTGVPIETPEIEAEADTVAVEEMAAAVAAVTAVVEEE
ncbi:MAG: 30S ribosomal protein S16 [Candidatus Promineifilaceae bacterium]|nr:30S ribosomal protein S16 [Candidatus Promineifilaceae bacterium]